MKNFFKKITLLFVIGISGSTVLAIDPNETPQSTQANHMQGNTRGRPQRRFYPGQNRSFRVMPQTPAQPAVYRTRPLSENQRALQQAQNIVAQIQQKQHQATLIHQVALMQPENHPFHAVLGAIQQTQAFAQRVVWPSIANLLNPITPFPIQNAAVQEELAELRNQIDETEAQIGAYAAEMNAHLTQLQTPSTNYQPDVDPQIEEEVVQAQPQTSPALHPDPIIAAQLLAIQNIPLINPPVPQVQVAPIPTRQNEPTATTQNQTGQKRKRGNNHTPQTKVQKTGLEAYPEFKVLTNEETAEFQARITANRAQRREATIINNHNHEMPGPIDLPHIDFTPEQLIAIFNSADKGSLTFLLNHK